MKPDHLLLLLTLHHLLLRPTHAQPSTTGYNCTTNTTYPCQTYVYYYATSPDHLDLASIGDLFSLSRRSIAIPSNISTPSAPLAPNQPLLIPITCSCSPNTSTSSALLPYTILSGDTFYYVSTHHFQNLTTYQAVELANPSLVPTNLDIGTVVNFPIFCKCAAQLQLQNNITFLVTYVLQPGDTLASVATKFLINETDLSAINPKNDTYDTIFIPVSKLPTLPSLPFTPTNSNSTSDSREGEVRGLGIGLGFCGVLLILVVGLWVYRERVRRKMRGFREVENGGQGKGKMKVEEEVNLLNDVSGCLDKYKVFGIGELREATCGFDEGFLIQGSVYKGVVGGEVYAIKKMKWNAYEELKILQKVNHGNLVKLEGFCIDPEDANCYLVYEYIENGSLYSWLHENTDQKLSWKTRLRIAIDVTNGLQYIHEHTRPRVVHKDIKSSNILLDSNMRAKIANFGLAKSGCNAITMHIVGTQGYISPEYLADGIVSTKMDVFSFGVVLLELISGKEAVDKEGRVLWASATRVLEGTEEEKVSKLRGWMDGGFLEESGSIESLMNVMVVAVACIHKEPSKRPSMVDIVYALCKSDDLFFDISDDAISTSMVLAR